MMQLNEFAEEVLAGVREKADGDFSAWTTTIHKNNGTSFIGITISGTENMLFAYIVRPVAQYPRAM